MPDIEFGYIPKIEAPKPIALHQPVNTTPPQPKESLFGYTPLSGYNNNLANAATLFDNYIDRNKDPDASKKIFTAAYLADRLGTTTESVLADYEGATKQVFGASQPVPSVYASIKNAYDGGLRHQEAAIIAARIIYGDTTPGLMELMEVKLADIPDAVEIARPFWSEIAEDVGTAVAGFGASRVRGLEAGAATGAVGLAMATPAALVAASGNVPAGVLVAAKGFIRGMAVGAAGYNAAVEAGSVAIDLLQDAKEAGIPKEVALPIIRSAATPVGVVNGAIEYLGFKYTPILGQAIRAAEGKMNHAIAQELVKGTIQKKAKAEIAKLALLKFGDETIKVGVEQVTQEFLQEASSIVGTAAGRAWMNHATEANISQATAEEIRNDLVTTIKETSLAMLVMAPLGGATAGVMYNYNASKQVKAKIAEMSKAAGVDDAIKATAKPTTPKPPTVMPEGATVSGERYDKYATAAMQPLPVGTVFQAKEFGDGFILRAGDSKKKELSHLTYEADPSEDEADTTPGTVTITGFAPGKNPAIDKALVLDLAKKYAGWDIEWEAQTPDAEALKLYLEKNNPRGTGVQWYSPEIDTPSAATLESVKAVLQNERPTWTPQEIDDAAYIVQPFAVAFGMKEDELVSQSIAPKVMEPGMIGGDKQGVFGAAKKVTIDGLVKTIIDMAPNANPATFTHEITHAFMTFGQNNRAVPQIDAFMKRAESVFGVTDGNWQGEFTGWTDNYKYANKTFEEAFAYALEDYIATGVAPTPESEGFFQRMAKFLYELYQSVKARVTLTPEITKFYDDMFTASPVASEIVTPAKGEADGSMLMQGDNTLGVFHNIEADQILKIDTFGGLPSPSLAVTKPELGFTQFGNTTLIADPSVAREAMNEGRLFDRDIWSPTVPKPEWRINNNILYKLSAKMKDAGEELDRWASIDSFNTSDITSGAERLIRVLERSTETQFAFLKEIGEAPEVQYKNKTMPSSESVILAVQKYLRSLKDNENVDVNEVVGIIKTTMRNDPEYADFEDAYIERHASGNRLNNIIDFAYSYEPGSTEVDYYATRDEIEKVIEGKKEQFKKWLTDQVEPAYSDPRITVQRKKIPFNAKTVMEWMRTQNIRGSQEHMTFGPSKAAAFAGQALESREEVAGKESNLVSQEESTQNWKENIEPLIDKINDELPKYYKYNDTWEALDSIYKAIANYFKGGTKLPSTARMRQSLSRELFTKVPNELIDKAVELAHAMINAPQDYFEAKPNRILTLSDFRAAVMPAKTDEKIKQAIRDRGIAVFEYDKEENRKQVVQNTMSQLEGILFQGGTDTRAFKEWFGDSKVVDEQGKPLVVYHGTPSDNIESFSSQKRGTGPITGNPIAKHGFFFAPDKSYAEMYARDFGQPSDTGNVMPVYLKLENPAQFNMWQDGIKKLANKQGVFQEDKVAAYIADIKAKGHDGIILSDKGVPTEYMVFSPTQIKSVNNRGTWDATDPRILYQGEETTPFSQAESDSITEKLNSEIDDFTEKGKNYKSIISKSDGHGSLMRKMFAERAEKLTKLKNGILDGARKFTDDSGRIALIHQGTRDAKYQVSFFDKYGAYTDRQANTPIEIIKALTDEPYYQSMFFDPELGHVQIGDILFQGEVIRDEVKATARTYAEQGQTIEQFIADMEAPMFEDERIAWGIPDISPEAKQAWYREAWDAAIAPAPETEPTIAEWVKGLADDGYAGVRRLLSAIWENVIQAKDAQPEVGADTEEIQALLAIKDAAAEMYDEIAPPIISGALAIGAGRNVSTRFLSTLQGIIKANPEAYARVAGDITGDKKLAAIGKKAEAAKNGDIEGKELDRLTISQRTALGQQVDDEKLSKAIISGKVAGEDVADYVKRLKKEELADKKRITTLDGEVKALEEEIDAQFKTIGQGRQERKQAQDELKKIIARIDKLINAGQDIPAALESQRVSIEKRLASTSAKLVAAQDWMEIENQLQKEQRRENFADLSIQQAKARGEQVSGDDIRTRQDARDKIAELTTKLKVAKDYKNSAQLQTYLAKLEERTALQDKYAKQLASLRAARKISQYKDSLRRQVVRAPGKAMNIDYQQQIIALQQAAKDRGIKKLSISELETLATKIMFLREIGNAIQRAKNEDFHLQIEADQAEVLEPILDNPGYDDPDVIDLTKPNRKSFLNRVKEAKYSAKNARRFIRDILDDGVDGPNVQRLWFDKETVLREQLIQQERRKTFLQNAYLKEGVNPADYFSEEITIPGAAEQRKDIKLTKDDLMSIELAFRNEDSRQAILYGKFFSPDERKAHEYDMDWFDAEGEYRFSKIMDAIDANLTEADFRILEAYEQDSTETAPRLTTVQAEVYNLPFKVVDHYYGIIRKGATAKIDEQMQQEYTSRAIRGKAPPRKGFTKERVHIAPWNQTDVKIGLINTVNESIDRQEHLIAYAKYVKEIESTYKTPKVEEDIRKVGGDAAVAYLYDYIDNLKNPQEMNDRAKNDGLVRFMRGNVAFAALAFRTASMVTQITTSVWPAMQYSGPVRLMAEAAKMMANPIAYLHETEGMSIRLRARAKQGFDVMQEAIKSGRADTKIGKTIKKIESIGMLGMELVDRFSVCVGWRAMYDRYLDEFDGDEQKALEMADDKTMMTQPSSFSDDLAPMFQNKSGWAQIILQFQSALNVIFQNIAYDMPAAVRSKNIAWAIGIVTSYAIAGILLKAAKTHPKDDETPEEKAKRLFFWSTTQATDSIPLVGEIATNFTQRLITGEKAPTYPDSIFPGVQDFFDGLSAVTEGDMEKAGKEFLNSSVLLGVPVQTIKDFGRLRKGDYEVLLGRPAEK